MYLLTENQISTVAKDVEDEGINFSHLGTELIDHICCGIEEYMNNGISFAEAYSQVKEEFGIKGLRRIQQDTLMLIDKNYRIMKNSMKTIGVIALAIMAFSALFKIMHWPFAGPMLVLSFALIVLVFFPALLYVLYRDVNEKKQAGIYIISLISGEVFMAGVLFKIMHWPYAQLLFFPGLFLITYVLIPVIIIAKINKLKVNKTVFLLGLISLMVVLTGLIFKVNHWPYAGIMLIVGAIFLVVIFVPTYYVLEIRNAEKLRIDFLFGIIAMTYFVIFTFLQVLSAPEDLMLELNYQAKSYQANASILENFNKKLLKDTTPDLVIELAKQSDLLYNEIEDLKVQIMQASCGVGKEEAVLMTKNNVYTGVNKSLAAILPENNANSLFLKLKKDIEQFNNIYGALLKDSLPINIPANPILNTKEKFNNSIGRDITWEAYHFNLQPPALVINTLSLWQYNIRLAENKALTTLVNNPQNN